MANTQAALARLLDEAAIRTTTARFADAAMRGDYDMFRSVWADDAEWTIGQPSGARASGGDDIVAMFRRLRADKEFFVQFALPGVIEIDGDHATARCICHEAARGPGEKYYRNHCVALDRLRRSGDGWVFVARAFEYLWLDFSPFTGEAFPLFPDRAKV